jgi:hypothetical protein
MVMNEQPPLTGSSYKTLILWSCKKSMTKLDSNDWSDFPNWKTNKGYTVGVIGPLAENGLLGEQEYKSEYQLLDGGFIKYSLTILLVLMIFF